MIFDRSFLKGHKDTVNFVRKFNDNLLVSGSDDSTIRVWDLVSGRTIKCIPNLSEIAEDAYIDDNVLYICVGREIRRYDLRVDAIFLHNFESSHSAESDISSFNVFGGNLVYADSSNNIITTNKLDSSKYTMLHPGHSGLVSRVLFDSNSNILSGAFDCNLKLWNSTGTLISSEKMKVEESENRPTMINPPYIHDVCCILPSLLGTSVISAGLGSGHINFFSSNDLKPLQSMYAHNSMVTCVSPFGQNSLLSTGNEGLIKLWSVTQCMLPKTNAASKQKKKYAKRKAKKKSNGISEGMDNDPSSSEPAEASIAEEEDSHDDVDESLPVVPDGVVTELLWSCQHGEKINMIASNIGDANFYVADLTPVISLYTLK